MTVFFTTILPQKKTTKIKMLYSTVTFVVWFKLKTNFFILMNL